MRRHAADKRVHRLTDHFHDVLRAFRTVFANGFGEPFQSEILIAVVACFNQAVGVENQNIAEL